MRLKLIGYLGFGLFESTPLLRIIFIAFRGIGTVSTENAGVSASQKIDMGLGTAIFGWILSGSEFDGAQDVQGIVQTQSNSYIIEIYWHLQ